MCSISETIDGDLVYRLGIFSISNANEINDGEVMRRNRTLEEDCEWRI